MIITGAALQIQGGEEGGTQREDEILFLIRETKGEPFSRLNLLKGEAFLFITDGFSIFKFDRIFPPRKFLLKFRSKMNLRFLTIVYYLIFVSSFFFFFFVREDIFSGKLI